MAAAHRLLFRTRTCASVGAMASGKRPATYQDVLDEPELHLAANILVADVAAWRRERMARAPRAAYFTLAPDWICEILSPSNTRLDRTRKLPAYARAGIGHAWLVDPLAQTLEVFRLDAGRWTLVSTHAGDEPVTAEPFDRVALPAARWWADVEPESTGAAYS